MSVSSSLETDIYSAFNTPEKRYEPLVQLKYKSDQLSQVEINNQTSNYDFELEKVKSIHSYIEKMPEVDILSNTSQIEYIPQFLSSDPIDIANKITEISLSHKNLLN